MCESRVFSLSSSSYWACGNMGLCTYSVPGSMQGLITCPRHRKAGTGIASWVSFRQGGNDTTAELLVQGHTAGIWQNQPAQRSQFPSLLAPPCVPMGLSDASSKAPHGELGLGVGPQLIDAHPLHVTVEMQPCPSPNSMCSHLHQECPFHQRTPIHP